MTLYPAIPASIDCSQAEQIAAGLLSDGRDRDTWKADCIPSFHPLWNVRFAVECSSLGSVLLPPSISATVDAVSARGHVISDTRLDAHLESASTSWTAHLDGTEISAAQTRVAHPSWERPHREPTVDSEQAERNARALAMTAVSKRAKLGIGFDLRLSTPVSLVLKPNWIVTAESPVAQASLLIDGLDGSYCVISYSRREQLPPAAAPS